MIFFKSIEQRHVHFIKTVFFLFGILSILFACKSTDRSKEKKICTSSPNFILILSDDQGWNGTSVKMMHNEPDSKSDYFETPNLEILAERGIRFSDAYSAAPVCAPSR